MTEINPAAYQGRNPSQNLADPARVTTFTEPPGFWRALALDVLGVAAALFFGYSYFRYLTTGFSAWYILGGLLIFATISVIQSFLASSISRRLLVILAEVIAMVAVFVFYDDVIIVIVAGAVTFIVLSWGFISSRSEIRNEMEIRFFTASRGVLGRVTTAALLFLLIVYAPVAQGEGNFIPRESFRALFSWSASFLDNIYPGVSFNGTFNAFAESFAKAELAHNPTFATLPPEGQNAAVEQAAAGLSTSIAQATGIKPAPNEPVSDVAYDYVAAMLANWKNQFKDQFLIVWIIVLFLILRTLGFLFVWFAQFVSLAVYEILLAAKFMRIEGVPQTKETIFY